MAKEYSYSLVLNAALRGNLIVASTSMSERLRQLYTTANTLKHSYGEMLSALKDEGFSQASKQADEYRKKLKTLGDQILKIEAQQRQVHFSDSMGRAIGAYQNLGSTVNVIRNMARPLVGMVDTAMEFEAAMSKVQALSKASDSQLQELTATAEKLGATTKFSATQSAEAMQYLALAGWDTNQIIGGMPGLLSLAAASGEDLALCADIVSDQLTAFGMSANQAGFMANTLAATSAAANTDVAQMGETLKYVGSVAGAAGYNFNDIAVAMGLMANASTKGSMAGTALRSTITRLINPPKEAAAALASINFDKLDDNGKLKGIVAQLEELRQKTKDMSKDELLTFSKNVAGAEAMSGFASLMTAKQEDWDKLKLTIEKANQGDKGAAEEMMAIMQNNTKGRVEEFKSAWESLSITIGKEVLPVLTPLIKQLTDCISKAVEFGKANPHIIQFSLALAGVAAGAAIAIKSIIAVSETVTALKAGINMLTNSGPLPIIPGGVTMPQSASLPQTLPMPQPAPLPVVGNKPNMFVNLRKSAAKFTQELATFGSLAVTKFTTPFKAAGSIFKTLGAVFAENTITPFIGKITAAFSGLGGKITTLLSGLGGKIMPLIGSMMNPLKMLFAPLVSMLSGPLTAAFGGVIASFGGLATAALPIIGIIAAIVAAGYILYANWETISNVISVVGEKISSYFSVIMTNLQPVLDQAGAALSKLAIALGFTGESSEMLSVVFNTLGSVIAAVIMAAMTIIANFVSTAVIAFTTIVEAVTGVVNTVSALLQGDWAGAWEAAGSVVTSIINGIQNAFGSLVSNVVSGIQSIAGSASSIPVVGSFISSNAEGGIYNKGAFLTTFAEEGPEAAIPLNGSSRGKTLWEQAGEIGGYSTTNNSSSNSYNVSIPVNITGNVDNSVAGNIASQIESAVRKALESIEHENRRVSFA